MFGTLPFRRARSLVTLVAVSSLASCALPPREAWYIVQTRGLIAYLNGDYDPTLYHRMRYAAYGAPLQPHHMYQQQGVVSPVVRPQPGSRYLTVPPAPAPAPRVGPPYAPPPLVRPNYVPPAYVPPNAAPIPSAPLAAAPKRTPAKPKSKPSAPSSTAPSKGGLAEKTVPLPPSSPAAPSIDALPYGTAVAGRPGMVNSPYAQKQQLVDVSGMGVGQAVKCPYTGKLFRVPPTQQAGAATATEPATKPEPSPAKPSSR